jgi:hypothetical protein
LEFWFLGTQFFFKEDFYFQKQELEFWFLGTKEKDFDFIKVKMAGCKNTKFSCEPRASSRLAYKRSPSSQGRIGSDNWLVQLFLL